MLHMIIFSMWHQLETAKMPIWHHSKNNKVPKWH